MPCDRIIARIFQSTLLQEERQRRRKAKAFHFKFQSTLLQEERHVEIICDSARPDDFNPRSYKRSDYLRWENLKSSL